MREKSLDIGAETDRAAMKVKMCGTAGVGKFLGSACSSLDAGKRLVGDNNLDTVGDGRSVVEIFRSLGIPKLGAAYLDGGPADYWRVLRSFEAQMASKALSSTARLSFLIQYCRGLARMTTEGCAILPSDESYVKARSILESRFG